jgi:hypothetical protein
VYIVATNTGDDSVLYDLECITDNPKYEGFAFVRGESLRGEGRLSGDFMPKDVPTKGRGWTVQKLAPIWTPQQVEGRVRAFNDYPCVNLSIPAFSRRAVDVLRDFLEANGELLPLVSQVGEYYVYNITTVADILNHEQSKIKWYNKNHDIAMEIKRYHCHSEKLAGLTIFRLVEKPASTFVTQAFVDRVKEHGLEGFHFIKLWSSAKRSLTKATNKKPRIGESSIQADNEAISPLHNSAVILLTIAKSKPTKAEKSRLEQIMNEIDALLYDPASDSQTSDVGSLEGNDYVNGQYRLFFSCPDANALVAKLLPWLKSLSWSGTVGVVKRYGAYDNPECEEEHVTL